jgi:hypothetical protein
VRLCFLYATASGIAKQLAFRILLKGISNPKALKRFIPKSLRNCLDNSFVEGTLVQTIDGLVPIEQVEIGDFVKLPAGVAKIVQLDYKQTTTKWHSLTVADNHNLSILFYINGFIV